MGAFNLHKNRYVLSPTMKTNRRLDDLTGDYGSSNDRVLCNFRVRSVGLIWGPNQNLVTAAIHLGEFYCTTSRLPADLVQFKFSSAY
jgi:hypothetical protein